MVKALADKITLYIKENSYIKDTDNIEKINYSVQVLVNETFKLIVLFILFTILGKLNYFLFSFMILFSTRTFSGGYHSSSTLMCLFWTTVFFLFTSIICPLIPVFNIGIYYILALVSITTFLLRSPCENKSRPTKNKKRIMYFKIISTCSTIFWMIVLLFFISNKSYLNCGFFTILIQLPQLVYLKREDE
ncbi:accessory gene regulator B family protein [Clostridium sp. LBM24168]